MHHLGAALIAQDQENVGRGATPDLLGILGIISHKPAANVVPIADRLTLSVDETAQLSGLPRSFIVKSIHSGTLKAIRIGRSYHVKRQDLDAFVKAM